MPLTPKIRPRAADPVKLNNGARANARRKRERMQSDAELARRFQPIVRELIRAGRVMGQVTE